MADVENYNALQQPVSTYGSLQSPGLAYAQTSSGGGGSGAQQVTAKTYVLPEPETKWSNNLARFPSVSKLPLYEKAALNYDQIKQQHIGNCYLGATLASMANTKVGRAVIKKMIKEKRGPITTICKKFDSGNPPGPEMQIKSGRWFTVSFKNQAVDVSDVLYHDDSDRNPNLQYMTTPNGDKALWGAITEVAYARLKGNYDNISYSSGLTVNDFLNEFCPLNWDILPPDEKIAIKKACTGAGAKATFIATLDQPKKLTGLHGYAVLGMNGSNVKLWDPMDAKVKTISFNDLLTEVQAVITSK